MNRLTRDDILALDKNDPLSGFRDRFSLPDGVLYFDGNSLGALPKVSAERLRQVVDREWGRDLIRSWETNGWMELPQRAGGKIAQLIGAQPDEVVVCDSTSVNLFKLLVAAIGLRPERSVIVVGRSEFPTDQHISQGVAALLGRSYSLRTTDDDVRSVIDADVAAGVLSHVNYKTGRMQDIAAVTAAAREHGAAVIWDLSHSAGALPVDVGGGNADFAVGCGYKYLNGGPGAPAYLYVARHLHDVARSPITGWMGHAAPLDFGSDYRPAEGAARLLCGTPPILSMAALDAALDITLEAGIDRIRDKSQRLTDLFIALIEQECGGCGFEVVAPEPAHRGSQVCLRHADAARIMEALMGREVIGDFRPPDLMRFGFAPLYNRFADVWDAAAVLREVMRPAPPR